MAHVVSIDTLCRPTSDVTMETSGYGVIELSMIVAATIQAVVGAATLATI